MSKKRMAGEKLDERFGEGFTERVRPDGIQDATENGNYSRKELLAEFRSKDKGVKINEGEGNLVDKYQGLVDSGTGFNNQARSYLESHGVVFGDKGGKPDKPVEDVIDDPVVTPTDPTPRPPIAGPIQTINPGNPGDTDGVNVNINQDNDITNDINGNGNVVTNNQDNSISVGGYGKESAGSDFKNMWMNNFFN